MRHFTPGILLAVAIATGACASSMQELVELVTHAPPPNADNSPPLPPPPQPAVWADTLHPRGPFETGRLIGEISSGGDTKSCYYVCPRVIRVSEMPEAGTCPATVSAPLR